MRGLSCRAHMAAERSDFGAALRSARLAARLTQEELAARAGLSVRGIQDLERGARRSPRPETLRRLRAALSEQSDATGTAASAVEQPPRSDQLRQHALAPRPTTPLSGRFPVAQTSFVGRDAQLMELAGLLRVSRLLTLVGPGGVGKTRLALAAAEAGAPLYGD